MRLPLRVLLLAATATSSAAPPALKLRWQLEEDVFTGSGPGTARAALTLTNKDTRPLPARGWALYFNALHEPQPGSVGAGFTVERVTGDLQRLVPGERWEREVLYGLERQERRLDRTREALAHTLVPRRRDCDERPSEHVLPFRVVPCRGGQLELFGTARKLLRRARGDSWTRQWLLFSRRPNRWEQNPERAARRAVFRLASKAMSKPLRDLPWLSRTLRGISLRQR